MNCIQVFIKSQMFPDNVIFELLLYSEIGEICNLCHSGSATRRVGNNDLLWQYLVRRDFPTYNKGLLKGTWLETYKFLYGPYYEVRYENTDIRLNDVIITSSFDKVCEIVIDRIFAEGIKPPLERLRLDISDLPTDTQAIILNAQTFEQISSVINPEHFTQFSHRLKLAIKSELISGHELDMNNSPWIRYMIYRTNIIW